ncbi:hypothetical protein LguiB_013799 [Lonicera macranthoides]
MSLRKELIFFILQFCDEEDLKKTANVLEEETGIFFDMMHFENLVLGGNWDEAERYLLGFIGIHDDKISIKIYFEIRKQKFLEALDHLNLQHINCIYPRTYPEMKTLFIDHQCQLPDHSHGQSTENNELPSKDTSALVSPFSGTSNFNPSRTKTLSPISDGVLNPQFLTNPDVTSDSTKETDSTAETRSVGMLNETVGWNLEPGSSPTTVDFHPIQQNLLLVGTNIGGFVLWEVISEQKLLSREHLIEAHVGGVNYLAFSKPNEQLYVITCGDDKLLRVWDVTTGVKQYVSEGHEAPIYSICSHVSNGIHFGTSKNKFLAAGDEHLIKVWDMNNVELLETIDADGELVRKELIFFILQFCDEEDLKKTAHVLEEETGIFFDMMHFENLVLGGNWDEAKRYLLGFIGIHVDKISIKIYFEIRKQKFLEALDHDDRVKALDILLKDLKVFASSNEELYKEMTLLLTLRDFSLNLQHINCIYPRTNPEMKTLFINHQCQLPDHSQGQSTENNPLPSKDTSALVSLFSGTSNFNPSRTKTLSPISEGVLNPQFLTNPDVTSDSTKETDSTAETRSVGMLNEIEAHVGGINDLAFSKPNEQLYVITCGDDKLIKVRFTL